MVSKNRRRHRAKPKNSSEKKTAEFSSTGSDKVKPPEPSPEESQLLSESRTESQTPTPTPPDSNATPTTDALASMNAQNLYNLSLVCFSISLILFVSTYNMIVNNGGTSAVFGVTIPVVSTPALAPAEYPMAEAPSQSSNKVTSTEHDQLLVGYKILHHTLKKESQLKYLHWLRDATFRGPRGSLKTVMTTVYQTSQTRTRELEQLFVDQSPRILLKDAPESAMGDSIQGDVEKTSTRELAPLPFSSSLSSWPHLEWNIRFLFIQAQATRMVVALSTSLLKFEANEERKLWLVQLADEFEEIRETLVESMLEFGGYYT